MGQVSSIFTDDLVDARMDCLPQRMEYMAETLTDLARDLPLVSCFSDQLHQAMVNLVINATHIDQNRQGGWV